MNSPCVRTLASDIMRFVAGIRTIPGDFVQLQI